MLPSSAKKQQKHSRTTSRREREWVGLQRRATIYSRLRPAYRNETISPLVGSGWSSRIVRKTQASKRKGSGPTYLEKASRKSSTPHLNWTRISKKQYGTQAARLQGQLLRLP